MSKGTVINWRDETCASDCKGTIVDGSRAWVYVLLRAGMLMGVSDAYRRISQESMSVKLLNNRFWCDAEHKTTVSVKIVLFPDYYWFYNYFPYSTVDSWSEYFILVKINSMLSFLGFEQQRLKYMCGCFWYAGWVS